MNRAIIELVTAIQPGDLLKLCSGSAYISAGGPVNTCDHLRRERGGIASPMRYGLWMAGWLVSVKTDFGYMPVSLGVVMEVWRGKVLVWSASGERVPVQMEMFGC